MHFTSRYGKPFIMLLMILPLMTGISFYLYQKYLDTAETVSTIIIEENIHKKQQLFQNFVDQMLLELGDDFVAKLRTSEALRNTYESRLAVMITHEIKFLYLLHDQGHDRKLRYLLDTATDPDERGEPDQKFDAVTDIWKLAKSERRIQIQRQEELDTLWISFVMPIVVAEEVVAYVGADFSNEEYRRIKQIFTPLKDIYFYISVFMIVLLLTAYVQFILYYLSRKRSMIDPLTRVYNRQYLFELYKSINIDQYQLLLIDLDHFKKINDLYGHDTGDIVLKAATGRISSQIRESDILIRYGGEEFLLLLHEQDIDACRQIAQRIHAAVGKRPIKADEHTISMTLSIGINPYPGYAKNIDEAIKIADEQLYKAKSNGRNRIEIFQDRHQQQSHTTKRIQDVKNALRENRIQCMYQPIFDVQTEEVRKYELLVRLIEPDGKIVTPDNFLPAIAHTKEYTNMTKIILESALQTMTERAVELNINLSMQDIFNNDIMAIITSLLMEHSDLAKRLTFEILETDEISDFDLIRQRVNMLKTLGVKIALDDFGSGYANFTYLVHLGLDILKIDGSLIRDIDQNENAYNIVQTISDFAKRLEIATVAEHVERKEELEIIGEFEIDYAQGYYLGKPDFTLLP